MGYIYVFEARGKFSLTATAAPSSSSSTTGTSVGVETGGSGVIGMLANRVTFTFALTDMLFWGYLWSALREEAREVLQTLARLSEREGVDE